MRTIADCLGRYFQSAGLASASSLTPTHLPSHSPSSAGQGEKIRWKSSRVECHALTAWLILSCFTLPFLFRPLSISPSRNSGSERVCSFLFLLQSTRKLESVTPPNCKLTDMRSSLHTLSSLDTSSEITLVRCSLKPYHNQSPWI